MYNMYCSISIILCILRPTINWHVYQGSCWVNAKLHQLWLCSLRVRCPARATLLFGVLRIRCPWDTLFMALRFSQKCIQSQPQLASTAAVATTNPIDIMNAKHGKRRTSWLICWACWHVLLCLCSLCLGCLIASVCTVGGSTITVFVVAMDISQISQLYRLIVCIYDID